MKKVIVIGCPGSGKSTFAKALAQKTGLPLVHLDRLYWNADKTTVSKEEFAHRLALAVEGEAWILDGNYANTLEMRLRACDAVFLLWYPTEVCIQGVRARKGKERSDMPWVEEEEDEEFLEYIRTFDENFMPQMQELLQKYAHKDIYVFKTREDADAFLHSL